MKRRITFAVSIIAGLSLATFEITSGNPISRPNKDTSVLDSPEVKAIAIPPDTVVSVRGKKCLFIGDSHTSYHLGWQDRLCRRTGMTYLNTSVGGKTTTWMKGIAKASIHRGLDYCFIWGGANDMAGTTNLMLAVKNVQYMVDLCLQNGVRAVVLTGFDPKTCIDVRGKGESWQKYPSRYVVFQQMLQDSIVGAKVIRSHFISRSDGDCGDFICHMSASGHRKMADGVAKGMSFKIIN